MLPEVSLRRGAKRLVVRSLSSPLGGSVTVGWGLSRALKLDYGPLGEGPFGQGGARAASCFSIDFDVTEASRYEANSRGTFALLELAARYDIPITWAVCGKAAEEDRRAFSAILDASGRDEVGVHTYSHIDASRATKDEFRADVERCKKTLGVDSPLTFIFPWNREAHFDVLRDLGFRCFRGARRAMGVPVMKEGLLNIRPVYYIDEKSVGAGRLLKSYVDLAIARSSVFHLWSHPWSLVAGGGAEPLMDTLEDLFEHLAARRTEHALSTMTMGGVSTLVESRAPSPAAVRQEVHPAD